MFIRVKTTPNSPRKSIQIVESVRDGQKVHQRIVRHVGVALNEEELVQLKQLAEHIKAEIEEEHAPTLLGAEKMAKLAINSQKNNEENEEAINVNLRHLRELQRSIIGIHAVYGKVYRQLGFDEVLKPSRHGQSASDILFQITMARIANPDSKRASVESLETDFGVKLNLQSVYRMMDKLDGEACERIQSFAYQAALQMCGKIDVIFFDATTLYFESFTEDELKQNGFSKDHKFGQPQVLFALMVTEKGLPIGYEAFPGSTYEGHTLIPMLNSIKKKYDLGRVMFVADSGMLNTSNLVAMEEAGFKYILGARLRGMGKAIQSKIIQKNNYSSQSEGKDRVRLATFELGNKKRLLVSHSEQRARKDAHDRRKGIEKLVKKLKKNNSSKGLISHQGSGKYLRVDGEAKVHLDEKKCLAAAAWDGLHGVITNDPDITAEEALAQYGGLWQVEESFRITKHDLKVRPIYHWTPDRIRAHLAISFMAFTCVRHLEYRVSLQYMKLSPEVIRAALVRVQCSLLVDRGGEKYVLPSGANLEAEKIYKAIGLSFSSIPYRLQEKTLLS